MAISFFLQILSNIRIFAKKNPFEWDIFEWFFTIVNPGNFLQRIGYTPQNQKDCEECYGAAVPSRYLAWHESKWKIFIPENPCEYYCTRTFHFFQGNCQRRRIFSLDDDLIPSSIRWSNHRVTREKKSNRRRPWQLSRKFKVASGFGSESEKNFFLLKAKNEEFFLLYFFAAWIFNGNI